MRHLSYICIILLLLIASPAGAMQHESEGGVSTPPQPQATPGSFTVLCYHNIEDTDPDQRFNGVSTLHLNEQFAWLKHEGYTAVSIDDLLAAQAGHKLLPEKAVLLTFDDGYESFYTRVYPLLKSYHYPAVIGIVDEWMTPIPRASAQPSDMVKYNDATMPRDAFLTWAQLREMKASGLVEIASHSHALHFGVNANPQGNTEPAAVTLAYDKNKQSYRSRQDYFAMLEADAEASAQMIARETGSRPRIMIWPYGAYNQTAVDIEKKHGMPITMTLEDGMANIHDLSALPRYLLKDDPDIDSFAVDMRQMYRTLTPMRTIDVDLDRVYDADPEQLSKNMDALISRIHTMSISTVYLKAYSDPDHTGTARSVYFPNRVLPMRADLFNRVVWQLMTRNHVRVYGWLPVTTIDPGTSPLTIDERRKRIVQLYEDMAQHGAIAGLRFESSDGNDNMIGLTAALTEAAQRFRRPITSVLVVPSSELGTPHYMRDLSNYNYTVLKLPDDLGSDDISAMTGSAATVQPDALRRTLFEFAPTDFQFKDNSRHMAELMKQLALHGALNFGYTGDDFANNRPDEAILHPDFSLQEFPYLP